MSNRYEQVLLTYARQWQFWGYIGGWAGLVVLTDLVRFWIAWPLLFVFITLAATGPAAVIGHAKQQIADARAALTPGFRGPHMVVAIAFSVMAIVVMPLLSYRAFASPMPLPSLLGLTSAVALASAGFASLAYFQSVTSVIVNMLGASLFMLPLVREVALHMLFRPDPLVDGEAMGIVVITLATGILGWIFYRLAVLREDMPEYARVLGHRASWSQGDARVRPQTDPPSLMARLQRAAADRRLRAMHNVFAAPIVRRVRHWKLSAEMGGTKWLPAALVAGFLTVLPLLTGEASEPQGNGHAVVAMAAVLSVLMPVLCITATWMVRRRSMGYELTRPASRQQFVREFGLTIATDLAEWWMWLTLAATVPVLVWGPPLRWPEVTAMLVLSAAEQTLAFGILVSILRVRSPRASDGSIIMSIIAVILPIMVTAGIPRTPVATLAIALGVAALGTALTYDAYRRWCEADLA